MPTKKKVAKKVAKKVIKKPAKKTVKRASRKVVSKRTTLKAAVKKPVRRKPVRNVSSVARARKISLVLKNLFLFGVLFIISIVVAWISGNDLITQLFYILAILTGFVAVAFLIILLIFFFMKQIRR